MQVSHHGTADPDQVRLIVRQAIEDNAPNPETTSIRERLAYLAACEASVARVIAQLRQGIDPGAKVRGRLIAIWPADQEPSEY